MREKTEGRHSGCLPLYDTPGRICRNVHRFAIVLRCKPLDRLLVLLYVERTGTVNENSAGTQRLPHIAEDAPSARSAKFHIGFAPFGAGSRRFAEHPLARTRSIDQHQVEIVTQRREMRRIVVRYQGIPDSPFAYVIDKRPGPLADHFVGDNQPRRTGQGRKQRRFTARSGTEIEYAQRGIRFEQLPEDTLDKHRPGLLHIIGSRMKRRIERKRRTLRQVVPVPAPRHFVPGQLGRTDQRRPSGIRPLRKGS